MFLRFHANSLDSYNEFTPPEPISVSVFMAQHKFKLKRSFTRIVRFYANSLGLYISRYLKTFNLLTRSFIQAMILRFRANSLDFYNEFTPPEPKSVSVIILQHKLKLMRSFYSIVLESSNVPSILREFFRFIHEFHTPEPKLFERCETFYGYNVTVKPWASMNF